MLSIPTKQQIDAEIALPGSKSITNRALVIGALARGETELANWLRCDDTGVMIEGLRSLGFTVTDGDGRLVIAGRGGLIPRDRASLDTANSGTTMRFLTGLVALGEGTYQLDGSPRMRERPIEDLLDGLRSLGVSALSDRENGCPPVTVRAGGLPGGTCELSGEISSQFLSALLLSAPYAAGRVIIRVAGELVSRPYVDMTLRMMTDFGVTVNEEKPGTFFIPPRQVYRGRRYAVEGDASSASYFFAAAAITGGRVKILNVGNNSIQGDARFPRLLERMGATVRTGPDWTEVAGPLTRGIKEDLNEMPDMVPTLAVVSLFAPGRTVIVNVGNLRYKESDRLRAVATELRKIGARAEELPDGLIIEGGDLHGAEIETYNDHRIAMAFALAGLRVPGITIKNPECVAKTFPGFFEAFLGI
ncbi:MAG: 3-phosphoshikimate 1-carboxyvinyltransferase [PVC group bacterium]